MNEWNTKDDEGLKDEKPNNEGLKMKSETEEMTQNDKLIYWEIRLKLNRIKRWSNQKLKMKLK